MTTYQVYLVGGAVRDQLLGLTVKDHDWVVTGATPDQLATQGYQQVGKQFPVFLHPDTKEEYALARKEKKQGQGYTGFICDFSPDIRLEEDLARRDLTINAIAQTPDGQLIDPFHGKEDLEHRLLRHVSDAFVEDPLRVLRVARFASRFHHFGFHIAPDTLNLMRQISHSGELSTLSPERVWKELEKALTTPYSFVFFDVLQQVDALDLLFPKLVWESQESTKVQLQSSALVPHQRWAIICQYTPLDALVTLHQNIKCPNKYKQIAEQSCYFLQSHHIPMSAVHWETWLLSVGAIKKHQPYKLLVEVLSLLTNTKQEDWLSLRDSIANINAASLMKQGFSGAELGKAMKEARITALEKLLHPFIT